MITAKISAGSSSIVQDIIDMCQNIHSPIGDWQGFVYNASTTGSKPWCVWALRMDEDAKELQYVYSTGLAAPPDAYELITVSCPTTTGFSLSFTTVNAMPSVVQTKGEGGGTSVSAAGNIVTTKMSPAGSSAYADYKFVANGIGPSTAILKCWYNSAGGNKPWAVYTVRSANGVSNVANSTFLFIMSGMASPPAGSEVLATTCPSSTTLTGDGYTQISGPLSLSPR